MKATRAFLDHTADILFQAEAGTLPELFEQCAFALEEAQVDLDKVEAKEKVTFSKESKSIEMLLFEFLEELVFYKDAENLLFRTFDIRIDEKADEKNNGQEKQYVMRCTASGERLDVEKHQPKVDVKAVTLHLFEVKKVRGGWKAQVLVDI